VASFGSIPHADLLKSVARRIIDRRVLHLIKMWLDCPVEETDQRGRKKRTTEARDNRRGIPQGSPLSAGESLHASVCVGVEEARP
jgi:RNA-directed DNA polymerase